MRSLVSFITLGVVLHKVCGAPIQNIGNGNPYLLNNLAVNNLVPVGFPSATNANIFANTNYLPNNCANAILDPIPTTNVIANTIIPNEVISKVPNTIANIIPNNLANIEFTNVQFTPLLPEVMASLQHGDVIVTGDLPITGSIKVSGCIPVYGTITVDGAVPSTGTAKVADVFSNQIADGLPRCANQYFI